MHQQTEAVSKAPINLSFDDFEISAESFKPVTKGLGFHQDAKTITVKPRVTSLQSTLTANAPLSKISREMDQSIKSKLPTGLEAFYASTQTYAPITQNQEAPISKEEARVETLASVSLRLAAWFVDLVIVFALVLGTLGAFYLASGINFQILLKITNKTDIIVFTSVLFSIYYLMYFTVLDLTRSIGKSLLGIKLVTTNNLNLSTKHTFIRSVVSLISLLVFCFPMLLDFQGHLSDTKVVK